MCEGYGSKSGRGHVRYWELRDLAPVSSQRRLRGFEIIEAIGSDVSGLAIGDAVYVIPCFMLGEYGLHVELVNTRLLVL